MTESPAIVGRCEKCGREFVTMPRDGLDHFGHREYGMKISKICGGKVVAVGETVQEKP